MAKVQFSIQLSDAEKAEFERLAKERNVSLPEAARRGLSLWLGFDGPFLQYFHDAAGKNDISVSTFLQNRLAFFEGRLSAEQHMLFPRITFPTEFMQGPDGTVPDSRAAFWTGRVERAKELLTECGDRYRRQIRAAHKSIMEEYQEFLVSEEEPELFDSGRIFRRGEVIEPGD